MDEINDLFSGMKIGDFLDLLGDFNHRDNFFYENIYGIESCDSKVDLYRDNVDEGELLDNLIDRYDDLDIKWIDEDFDELIKNIIETRAAA